MPRIEPFDEYPSNNDQWFIRNKYTYKSELLAIKNQFPKNKNRVEIGVGSDRFATPLGIKLGVEPSGEMRMLSKKIKIDLIDSIVENLPFRSDIFDFVLLGTTICFIDDIELASEEFFKILKPEDTLIIGFIDRKSIIGKLYKKHKESNVFYKVVKFYSVEEVISLLSKVKYKNFNFTQTIFHPLSAINKIEQVKKGYGKGSFVVIKAQK